MFKKKGDMTVLTWEPLGNGIAVATDEHCRFTADALLLARFAAAAPSDTACDLGSGSGVIPLMWCRHDSPQHILAVEREPYFFRLLQKSVEKNGLSGRITAVCADWETLQPTGDKTLITCNPPYFPCNGVRPPKDPLRRAVRQEDHPAMLQALCAAAAGLLAANGRFCLCHRPERLTEVLAALTAAGLAARRLQAVQSTKAAAARLVLIEAGKNGSLRLLPAHIEHPTATHTAVYAKRYDRDVT